MKCFSNMEVTSNNPPNGNTALRSRDHNLSLSSMMPPKMVYQAGVAALFMIGLFYILTQYCLSRTDLAQRIKRNGFYGCPHYRHRDFISGSDFGIAWSEAAARGKSQDWLRDNFARYGRTFQVISKGRRVLHTCDTANAQSILSFQANRFGIGKSRVEGRAWLGKGVTTMDGEVWRSSRALLKPIFAKAEISDLARLDKHLSRLLNELAKRNWEADLQPLFHQMV